MTLGELGHNCDKSSICDSQGDIHYLVNIMITQSEYSYVNTRIYSDNKYIDLYDTIVLIYLKMIKYQNWWKWPTWSGKCDDDILTPPLSRDLIQKNWKNCEKIEKIEVLTVKWLTRGRIEDKNDFPGAY